MKQTCKQNRLPIVTVVLGCCALILRRVLYAVAVDVKNLLPVNHPLEIVLWVLTAIAAAWIIASVWKLDGSAKYEDNFRPSLMAAVGHYIAAAGILLTVLLGFVIERAAYKPLRSAPRMSVMISAIGVSYLLQNLATYITGGLPQMYPSLPGLSSQITIAGTSTKMVTVITPFLVVALVVVLTQLINHTKIGMAMRAASRDFETAQLMGIKINNIISFTFVIGSFLAAVGSALYFTNYPSIVPLSGSLPGLRAFVAAVFGGIGSIPGAVVGAFLIGLSETVIKSSNWSVFSDAFTFALLIIILVVKPTGLFGEKSTDKV